MTGRTVIIVSPYFPPSTLAGVHRARHLAKHLPRHGWEPIVLCVNEAFHEQRLDPGLAALVPADREIAKVAALPIGLTRCFGLGEISLRAWRPLRRRLFELLATRRVDSVLITGSPYYPMLLAPEIKRRFKVPVLLDFQDPWVSAWGSEQRPWSKAGLSHKLAAWLEPRAVRAADFITSVSETQNLEMAKRYPFLDREQIAAIPIGGDPEDFDYLRNVAPAGALGHLASGKINLSYVGTFMPRTGEPMRALLRAFRHLKEQAPDLAARIRLNFIGTSNQPNDKTTPQVKPLAEQEGIAEAVYEVPERLPYLEALSILAKSDGILLIGSDEPHYTASKIYPALMSGTPYLSLFHDKSSSHAILSAAGGGVALSFDGAETLANLQARLADGLTRLAIDAESLGRPNSDSYRSVTAEQVAYQYSELLTQVQKK